MYWAHFDLLGLLSGNFQGLGLTAADLSIVSAADGAGRVDLGGGHGGTATLLVWRFEDLFLHRRPKPGQP